MKHNIKPLSLTHRKGSFNYIDHYFDSFMTEAAIIPAIISTLPIIPTAVIFSPSIKKEAIAVNIGSIENAKDTNIGDRCLKDTFWSMNAATVHPKVT